MRLIIPAPIFLLQEYYMRWEESLRIAMLSYHTCPLATLGGKDTGGMNVYVRELTRTFGRMGVKVDVFTRSQDEHVPHVIHQLGYGNRVVHIPAGPEMPLPKEVLATYVNDFSQKIIEFAEEKDFHYDAIHSHYWMSGIAAIELKKAWDIPIVHMFHTLGLMKNRIASEGEYEGEYRIKGELAVLRNADKIILNMPGNITFATNSSNISADFYKVLDSVALVINEFEKTYVDVYGYTDSTGSVVHNQTLSKARTSSVASYLISQEVTPQRVVKHGMGESQPIASNDTTEGRTLNRRVEIVLIPIT